MPVVVDDLQYKGLTLLRDTERFSYGHDAVLLANFVRAKAGGRMIDLGTGTGVIAILAHAKTGASVLAVDIDPDCCMPDVREGIPGKPGIQPAEKILQPRLR